MPRVGYACECALHACSQSRFFSQLDRYIQGGFLEGCCRKWPTCHENREWRVEQMDHRGMDGRMPWQVDGMSVQVSEIWSGHGGDTLLESWMQGSSVPKNQSIIGPNTDRTSPDYQMRRKCHDGRCRTRERTRERSVFGPGRLGPVADKGSQVKSTCLLSTSRM